MSTDLAQHIQATPMVDSHEHQRPEREFVEQGPDVLRSLFNHYLHTDLRTAGAAQAAIERAANSADPDLEARFAGVRQAWTRCRHTGYGEAVSLTAKLVYGIDEITLETLQAAESIQRKLRQPGQRLRLLRDVANLDHVQIDDNAIERRPDPAGPDFFLYDLYWGHFASGDAPIAELKRVTGIEVKTLADFRTAQQAVFAAAGPLCIALKTPHAYHRTLAWRRRTDAEAEAVLLKKLSGTQPTDEEANCLGDWSLAHGVELAIQYNLPVKIHTGYLAGWDNMLTEHVRPGLLCPLLLAYPKARFVLMHAAYPYSAELAAIAKNFTNVWIDLCWAWAMDPYSTANFARQLIHSVPVNKVFAFGGDTLWPMMTVGYAYQTRRWLTRALQAEIDDGLLTEPAAIAIASAWMRDNQYACFDVAGRRAGFARHVPG